MQFHEDVIFKNNGTEFGQELIEIVNIKGKIVKLLQTEYGEIKPTMYKPDLVIELEDRIIILEFQSTTVKTEDKRRFRLYTALIDDIKIKSTKPIEVHVLSTAENEQVKIYKISEDAYFPIYIHTLKNIDADKQINIITTKIKNNENITRKDLLKISLLCFMKSTKSIEQNISNSADIITNIKGLNEDLTQFVKGIIIILCDKFVEDEFLSEEIINKVGGNMQILEEYIKRRVDHATIKLKNEMENKTKELKNENTELKNEMENKDRKIIINLSKKGFTIQEIVEMSNISMDFVKQTLSNQKI